MGRIYIDYLMVKKCNTIIRLDNKNILLLFICSVILYNAHKSMGQFIRLLNIGNTIDL